MNDNLESRRSSCLCLVLITLIAIPPLASCSRPRELKIGVVMSFTGASSFISDDLRAGLEYQRALLSERKDIPPIRLEYRDDKASPELAKTLVADLAREGCLLIVGPVTSGIGIPMAEAAAAARIPVLSPTVSVGALAGKADWFFRLYPSAEELGAFLGRRAAESGIRSVAVAGDGTNAVFAEEWRKGFGEALRTAAAGARATEEDFAYFRSYAAGALFAPVPIADELLSASKEAILLVSSSTHAAALLSELAAAPVHPALFSSTWAFTSYVELVSYAGKAAEGVRSVLLFDPDSDSPSWKALDAAMRSGRGVPTSPAQALGAECLLAIAAAWKAGGHDRPSFRSRLAGVNFDGLQSTVSLDAFGDVLRPVYESVVRNGRVRAVPGPGTE